MTLSVTGMNGIFHSALLNARKSLIDGHLHRYHGGRLNRPTRGTVCAKYEPCLRTPGPCIGRGVASAGGAQRVWPGAVLRPSFGRPGDPRREGEAVISNGQRPRPAVPAGRSPQDAPGPEMRLGLMCIPAVRGRLGMSAPGPKCCPVPTERSNVWTRDTRAAVRAAFHFRCACSANEDRRPHTGRRPPATPDAAGVLASGMAAPAAERGGVTSVAGPLVRPRICWSLARRRAYRHSPLPRQAGPGVAVRGHYLGSTLASGRVSSLTKGAASLGMP